MLFRSSRPVFFKNVVTKKVVLRKLLEGLRPTTLWKKRLWHRSFHVNFAKFLRTHLFREPLRWLLLIFAVEFVEILSCYKRMIVRRHFEHGKNFFVILFKISVNISHMIKYGIIIKLSAFSVTTRIANIFCLLSFYIYRK